MSQNTDSDRAETEKIDELKASFFPGDWGEDDIEFLAEFLSHYNLGELGRILDPANDYDYHLYTRAENDDEDEEDDVRHTIDPASISNLESGVGGPGSGRELGGEPDEQ